LSSTQQQELLLLLKGGLYLSLTTAQKINLPVAGAGRDAFGLSNCLKEKFGDATVTYFAGEDPLPKVVFSPATSAEGFSMDEYNSARGISLVGSSLPAAILFVEKTQEVIDGVNCARENGYIVAPRGTGHSYQASSTADGTLVIDMKLTCTPDKFEVVSREKGDGILPGSKYAGIIRAPSGCTNAALLAAVVRGGHYEPSEGAMVVTGTCPSVGITGYVLGGGMGDVTPYAGLATDQAKAFDIVLYNGTEVTASPDENEDLYWALRGGGGGFGVVTNIYLQNIMSPSPTAFTHVSVSYEDTPVIRGEFAVKMQNFLYDHPKSPLFGGAFSPTGFEGIFLGPWDEAIKVFEDAGLLDVNLLSKTIPSTIMKNFNSVCDNHDGTLSSPCDEIDYAEVPQFGIQFYEVKDLAEAESLVFANTWYAISGSDLFAQIAYVGRTFNICEDLGINNSFCTFVPPTYSLDLFADGQPCADNPTFSCMFNQLNEDSWYKKEVVDAIITQASDITNLINQHGFIPSLRRKLDALIDNSSVFANSPLSSDGVESRNLSVFGVQHTVGNNPLTKEGEIPLLGGLCLPRLSDDTIGKIVGKNGFASNHLSHGANLVADKSSAAYRWRNSAWLTTDFTPQPLDIILADPAFDNDPNKLAGYYNYIGPTNMPNFLKMYWNDTNTINRLSAIRGKYDPLGGFNNDAYVPRGIEFGGYNTCENKEEHQKVTDVPILVPTKEPTDNKPTEEEECSSIVELACGVDDFSTLCSLLSSFTGLVDDLSGGEWTVFAPTNDAFAQLEIELDGDLDSISNGFLKKILLFHTINGQRLYADDMSCKSEENLFEMSNGKDARIKCKNGTPFGIKGGGNSIPAEFIDVDVEACNGIIHTIESVLLFK